MNPHKASVEKKSDASGLTWFLPKAQGCLVRYLSEKDRDRLLIRLKITSYILILLSYVLFYLVYAEFGEFQKIQSIFKVSYEWKTNSSVAWSLFPYKISLSTQIEYSMLCMCTVNRKHDKEKFCLSFGIIGKVLRSFPAQQKKTKRWVTTCICNNAMMQI